MRVCDAHKEKSVHTVKSLRDDSEYDFCPICWEAFMLVASGEFFRVDSEEAPKRRGRKPADN